MDKKMRFVEVKSIDDKKKTIVAYPSTYHWDRMDEKFVKGAWRLDNYRNSPVVLWAHDYAIPPIAKTLSIAEDENGLRAELQFDEQDEFAMKIFSMFKRGFLNTFSVGFKPLKYSMEPMEGKQEKGIVWTDAELLEFSAVAVPANPNATMSRSDAEILVKTLPKMVIKSIEGSDEVKVCPACDDADNNITEAPKADAPAPEATPAPEVAPEVTPEPAVPPSSAPAQTDAPAGEVVPETPKADAPEPDAELEQGLKNLIEMVKSVKGKKVDESKLALMKLSMASLNEIVIDNAKEVSREEFLKLAEIVEKLSEYIKNRQPDAQGLVAKFMNQLDMALKGYKAD